MKWKNAIVIFAVLILCWPAMGKTNIFGTEPNNHQFSAVVGSSSATVSWMWQPIEDFYWGPRISPALTGTADQKGSRWDTALVGVGIEYPAVGFESLFETFPVQGKAYLGLGIDFDPKDQFKAYLPIEAGVDVYINDHMTMRITKQLTELNYGNGTLTSDLRFGVAVRW